MRVGYDDWSMVCVAWASCLSIEYADRSRDPRMGGVAVGSPQRSIAFSWSVIRTNSSDPIAAPQMTIPYAFWSSGTLSRQRVASRLNSSALIRSSAVFVILYLCSHRSASHSAHFTSFRMVVSLIA